MNVRSLPKHVDDIELYLESIAFSFSFIGFTETRLSESKENLYPLRFMHSEKLDVEVGCLCIFKTL